MILSWREACQLSVLIVLTASTLVTAGSKYLRKPKVFGKSIPDRDLDPRHQHTRQKIVVMHNFYRTRVDPSASDMLEMSWHKGAQESAQRWAEECQILTYDGILGKYVEDYGSCGQNIFVSNEKVPWTFVGEAWFAERFDFSYGSKNNSATEVGHYTQMVWNGSHRIGCGFHYCGKDVVKKPFYNYVCNYCPMGNDPKRLGMPYSRGKPCSECVKHCKYKKLCTNTCPYADLWANCAQLNDTWNDWLCSNVEHQRHRGCRATCLCTGKVV